MHSHSTFDPQGAILCFCSISLVPKAGERRSLNPLLKQAFVLFVLAMTVTLRCVCVLIYFFSWIVIALQNPVGFCQISTWISHRYTYVPSLLNLLPISCPISLLWVVIEHLFEFPESYNKFPLAIYFIYGIVSFHVTLSIHLTLSFLPALPCPHNILHVCDSAVALHKSVPSF